MSLRDPSSLQDKVPQELYDYMNELWQEINRLSSATSITHAAPHTVPLAKLTVSGNDGAISFGVFGTATSFTDPT